MSARTVADYLDSLPALLRLRLLKDPRLSAIKVTTITLAGLPPVRRDQLFNAVRRAYRDAQPQQVGSTLGVSLRAEVDKAQNICVSTNIGGKAVESMLPLLALLSPDPTVRLRAFADATDDLGCTFLKRAEWREKVSAGPLSDEHFMQLSDDVANTHEATMSRLEARLLGKIRAPEELVSVSSAYLRTVFGGMPDRMGLPEFVENVVLPHWEQMGRGDEVATLKLVLPLCLGDSLDPAETSSAIGDAALRQIANELDSLGYLARVGLFELLAARADDEELSAVADRVFQSVIKGPSVAEARFIPMLLNLLIGTCRVDSTLSAGPGYFRRFSAWLYAAHVSDLLLRLSVDADKFSKFLDEATHARTHLACELECMERPLLRTFTSPRFHLHAFGIGKLMRAAASMHAPNADAWREGISAAVAGLGEEGFALDVFFPDLVAAENHSTSSLPPEEADRHVATLSPQLDADLSDSFWWKLAYVSQAFCLPDDLLSNVARRLPGKVFSLAPADERTNLQALMEIANIAAASKHKELGAAVLDKCVSAMRQGSLSSFGLITIGMRCMACFSNEPLDALGGYLDRLAAVASPGEAANDLITSMQVLRELLPIERWNFSLADALACSVAR